MLVTLIVPILFLFLKKLNIRQVWSLFNALQCISNIINLVSLNIPANSNAVLQAMNNITNFQILSQPFIKDFFKDKLGPEVIEIMETIKEIGEMTVLLITMVILVAVSSFFVAVLKKDNCCAKKLFKMKSKFVFNGIIRTIDQQYLPKMVRELKILLSGVIGSGIAQLLLFLATPFVVVTHLYNNRPNVHRRKFKKKFGNLY